MISDIIYIEDEYKSQGDKKMTQTLKTQKQISVIARCAFKANSYVLWGIQSGEKTDEVTCVNHTVTAFRDKSGEPGNGYQHSYHFKHVHLLPHIFFNPHHTTHHRS